ncbi:Zn(II)2Cys6 transcription factor [Aspergillus ibericus CBS 121593]|uniref:Zn(2)-C6 fungal-type domain-containing protein n=1 Tax=Aspergillus ibericus CBS 121593 TaxID=1448316 RepID=A0A395H7J0_9EURO|nr:hypothetical protein BO80DRAFT_453149 [Aspergillus ibericus CBS 121593]RAL03473.1 hypothetical protein BO80DRAFT_453149 [Aspergillus ibericus CBS 121593]
MVYRGKPSLGCELCRKRRLNCDRREPSCSQCLRVNQACSGYRDPNTLRILDQSKEVAVKAQARRTASKSPPADRTTAPRTAPPISPDELAMSYIFTHLVGTTQSQGVMSYLLDLLHVDPSPALQATIKAVGLASLSRLPESRRAAGKEYTIALRATNDALRDPVSAKSDSTLGAVLLLSTYEMITCNPADKMGTWKHHVQGATKLLELRGLEQLNSRAGLELFTTVRFQNAISSIFYRSSDHNTPKMAALSKVARSKRSEHFQPIENFYDLLLRLSEFSLRVDGAHLQPDPVQNLQQLIDEGLLLDADLESWKTSLSPFWWYTIVEDSHPGSELGPNFPQPGGKHHVYYNVNLASMWNHYRQARIVLNEMIRTMSLHLWELQPSSECRQTVYQSLAVMKQMAEDICATLPYHFTSGEAGFGALVRIMWPLFIAGYCKGADAATRGYIMHALDFIGNTAGMQQADHMAQMLREEVTMTMIPGS